MVNAYEEKLTSINIKLRELDPVTAADPRLTIPYITNPTPPPIASTSASATNPNPTPPTTNPTPTSTSTSTFTSAIAKRSYASSSEGDHASKRPKN